MTDVPPPIPEVPPPLPEVRALDKHHCPGCGAEARWDAGKQALVCPYCGTVSPAELASDGSLVKEHDLALALRAIPDFGARLGARPHARCSVRAARRSRVFEATRVAQRCEFCGSPAVVPYTDTRNVIHPESLLPFSVCEAQVRDVDPAMVRQPLVRAEPLEEGGAHRSRRRRLSALLDLRRPGPRPLARRRRALLLRDPPSSPATAGRETVQERRVRWVPAAGEVATAFDDELVAATQGIHAHLLRQIEPFPTTTLEPYDRGYVSGWVVEQYQIDLIGAAERARAVMDDKLRALCARDVPGDTYRNLEVAATYSDQTFKHALLPVWLLHYDYGRRSFQVVVNGVHRGDRRRTALQLDQDPLRRPGVDHPGARAALRSPTDRPAGRRSSTPPSQSACQHGAGPATFTPCVDSLRHSRRPCVARHGRAGPAAGPPVEPHRHRGRRQPAVRLGHAHRPEDDGGVPARAGRRRTARGRGVAGRPVGAS